LVVSSDFLSQIVRVQETNAERFLLYLNILEKYILPASRNLVQKKIFWF